MEIRDLQSLARLAEFGSLTRAAKDLGIETSTLSRRIGSLEDELGVLLFERGRDGMRATPTGLAVVRLAQRAISDVEAIRHVAARSSLALAGELRLAIQSASLGPQLRAALSSWRMAHPGVEIDLFELNDSEALSGMRERRIGVSIIHAQPTIDMEQLPLWRERLLLAVPDSHPLAGRASVNWAETRAETILVHGANRDAILHNLQAALLGPGVDLRVKHAGLLDVLNLVAIGEGAALVCENHSEIVFPGVKYVSLDEPDAQVGLVLAWPSTLDEPVPGSFVAFMRDWVKAHPKSESVKFA